MKPEISQTKSKNILKVFRQYSMILKKLISDSVWRFKGRSFLIVSTGFLGVTFQIQAIGLALYYAKAISKGNIVKLLGYEFQARSALLFLSLIGIGVLISLLLSAWLIYYSRSTMLKMGRKYEEFCSKRLFSLFGSSLRVWTPLEQGFSNDATIMRLARTDSRYCGRVFRLLLSAIVPFFTLIIAIFSLFYIKPFLTLSVIVLMGISAAFQYRVSILGSRSSMMMEEAASGASLEYRKIIRGQKGVSTSEGSSKELINGLFNNGEVKRFHDAYEGRLKVIEKSRFVSDILLAIAISAILVTMGTGIIIEKQDWGSLIIYLIALRYMLVNLKQSVAKTTSINRFLYQIDRYFQFLKNSKTPSIDEIKLPDSYLISANSPLINSSIQKHKLSRGSRLGLISPVELNRYTIAYLTDSLLGDSEETAGRALSSMWFITSRLECPAGVLRESMGLPDGYGKKEFSEETEKAGLSEMAEKYLPQGLETFISPDNWEKVETSFKFSLSLLAALQTKTQWIMLEEKGLRSLPDPVREYFLKSFSDRITVVVYNNDLSTAGSCSEDLFALIDESKVIGMGNREWLRENESMITDRLLQSPLAPSKKNGTPDDLDDELDDDI